ncbi:MAG TPA: 3'-5' exonuclease [Candidatus Elarobacter sp.]
MRTHVRDATYAIVDVETTGFSREHDGVVEVACVLVRRGIRFRAFSTLVNPGRPIPPRATEVHGIADADVADAPPLAEVAPTLRRLCMGAIVVAHNAGFDRGFLPMLAGRPGLCTLRLARHLLPELRSHANQALRETLGIALPAGAEAHRAFSDVSVTASILEILLNRYLTAGHPPDTEALLALAASRVRYPRFPFGRYRHIPLREVPSGYLAWMLRASDPPFDADVRTTVIAELARRRVSAFPPATAASPLPRLPRLADGASPARTVLPAPDRRAS